MFEQFLLDIFPFTLFIFLIGFPIILIITYYFHREFIKYIKIMYPNDWTKIIPKEVLPSIVFFRGKRLAHLKPISKYIRKDYIDGLSDMKLLRYYYLIRVMEIIGVIFALVFLIIPSFSGLILRYCY